MAGQTLKEGQHKGQENLESGTSEGPRKLSHLSNLSPTLTP